MCNATRETIYIWQLLSELGIHVIEDAIPVGIDNTACVRYSFGATDKLLKHVNNRTRYVEDMQEGGIVEILKIHTDINISDPLSKVIKSLVTQRRLLPMMVDVGFLQPGYDNPRLRNGCQPLQMQNKI